MLKHLNGSPHQVVIHFYIALGGRQVLVPGQLHDDLRRDSGVCQLGDEPPPAGMAGGSVETGGIVEIAHQLAQGVRGKRRPLLGHQEWPFRFYRVAQRGPIFLDLAPESVGHEHRPGMSALGDLR